MDSHNIFNVVESIKHVEVDDMEFDFAMCHGSYCPCY